MRPGLVPDGYTSYNVGYLTANSTINNTTTTTNGITLGNDDTMSIRRAVPVVEPINQGWRMPNFGNFSPTWSMQPHLHLHFSSMYLTPCHRHFLFLYKGPRPSRQVIVHNIHNFTAIPKSSLFKSSPLCSGVYPPGVKNTRFNHILTMQLHTFAFLFLGCMSYVIPIPPTP